MAHSRLASPAATADVLRDHDIRMRKSLGQHFLVDDNVVGRTLRLADLSGSEPVVEVGPGIGTLTGPLCEAAGSVVAVERDDRLITVLADTCGAYDNLRILHKDAVRVPMDDLATPLGPPCALVANLPYAVAATVVLRFFEELPSLRFAVVMVQAEVADRMSAVPGTKDWGAYSVKLQLRARSVGRFRVAPSCFMPPPRVDSAVLRLERVDDPVPAELMASASRMAEAAFAQRRKTLRNSVRSSLGVDSGQLDALLEETGIDGTRRAETLALDEYLELGAGAVRHGILP